MPFPPSSEPIPACRLTPGTEVFLGAAIRMFDRVVESEGGSFWSVYWQGIDAPTKFQEEPVLMVVPRPKSAA